MQDSRHYDVDGGLITLYVKIINLTETLLPKIWWIFNARNKLRQAFTKVDIDGYLVTPAWECSPWLTQRLGCPGPTQPGECRSPPWSPLSGRVPSVRSTESEVSWTWPPRLSSGLRLTMVTIEGNLGTPTWKVPSPHRNLRDWVSWTWPTRVGPEVHSSSTFPHSF